MPGVATDYGMDKTDGRTDQHGNTGNQRIRALKRASITINSIASICCGFGIQQEVWQPGSADMVCRAAHL